MLIASYVKMRKVRAEMQSRSGRNKMAAAAPPKGSTSRVKGGVSWARARGGGGAQQPELPFPWRLERSKTTGLPYYYNSVNGVSTLSPPIGAKVKGRALQYGAGSIEEEVEAAVTSAVTMKALTDDERDALLRSVNGRQPWRTINDEGQVVDEAGNYIDHDWGKDAAAPTMTAADLHKQLVVDAKAASEERKELRAQVAAIAQTQMTLIKAVNAMAVKLEGLV